MYINGPATLPAPPLPPLVAAAAAAASTEDPTRRPRERRPSRVFVDLTDEHTTDTTTDTLGTHVDMYL